MMLPYVVVVLVSVVAISWIVRMTSRRHRTISQLVAQLESSRADRLYPFVEGLDCSASWNDDALWAAIGGREGLWKIRHECGLFMTIARNARQAEPSCGEMAQDIFIKAFYLRGLMTWLCVAEDFARLNLPSIPRIHARSYARLYCDMAASLATVLEICGETVPH
jgi:hypothetical protein